MQDLRDVDASKPYLSIFAYFRKSHILQEEARKVRYV